MAYYMVGKYPVFYSANRFADIDQPFLETLNGLERIAMKMHNSSGSQNEDAQKLETIRLNKLNKEYKNLSQETFKQKWVEFDFVNQEAKCLAWELLHDYFHITKNGWIADTRSFNEKLMDDYTKATYYYPQGVSVKLNFITKDFFRKLFQIKPKVSFSKTINLTEVERVSGSLASLERVTCKELLKLSDKIEIADRK